MTRNRALRAALAFAVGMFTAGSLPALDLIVNGNFETGDLSGWTVANQPGGSGDWFIQSGTGAPLSRVLVPPPPGGTFAAMTDQTGPGSHVLYQDVVLPNFDRGSPRSINLAFDVYLGNRANDFFPMNSFNYEIVPNQQVRVDLLSDGADPFSMSEDDLLAPVFQTLAGDPALAQYNAINFNVSSALSGQTVRLRFAQVNNQGGFQFGLDNVRIFVTAIPEPASITLVAIAGAFVLIHLVARPRLR